MTDITQQLHELQTDSYQRGCADTMTSLVNIFTEMNDVHKIEELKTDAVVAMMTSMLETIDSGDYKGPTS